MRRFQISLASTLASDLKNFILTQVAGQSKCNCGKVKCTVVPRGCI